MVQNQKLQHVMIKGTKDGLTLRLDDSCTFEQLLTELNDKLQSSFPQISDGPQVTVNLQVGNRYLNEQQEQLLRDAILRKKGLVVNHIESNVVSKKEAEEMKRNTEITSVSKIIRSGQVLKIKGDLLLLGDVNPGGSVMASGNIFIMGALKGMAHAGCEGNQQAIITASLMHPSLLKIADFIHQPLEVTKGQNRERECAFIENEHNEIIIDRIQAVHMIRPELTRL
jgi:septum site-determining protein MinC